MGADQSRREERNNRDVREFDRAIETRLREHEQRMQNRIQESRVTITTAIPSTNRDVASKRDLEKALEEQRKIYEQKMKTLMNKETATTASVQQGASTSTQRNVASKSDLEKALEEQRQLYEMKIKNILENQQRPTAFATVQGGLLQQAAVQHAAMQQAAVQPVFAPTAQPFGMQQGASRQAGPQQAAAQQVAMQQAAAQQAAMQQAAAQQAAMQHAAAQQAAMQQAAAQQTAAQQQAAARQAAQQNAVAQQVLAQQKNAQQEAAQRQAAIQAIATESGKKMRDNGLTLRQKLHYSIDQLYAIKNGNTLVNAVASTSSKSVGKKKDEDDFVFIDLPFKDTLQNVQKARPKGEEDDITCPTCHSRYGEKIYQCAKGHSSCHLCKMRQVRCFTCHQPIVDVRNYTLEKYVAERRVKCPNAEDGCRLFIKTAMLNVHAKECPFKEMECPCLGPCNWTGKLPGLSVHFDDKHPVHRQSDVDKEMFLPGIASDSHTMHLVKIGNFNFLFHLKVSTLKQRISALVQLIGTNGSARKWFYEIHVYNKRDPRRKFHYVDRCTSNRESLEDIIGSGKCAVLPLVYAQTFVNEGALAYKFYIKQEEFNKENRDETKDEKVKKPYRRYGKTKRND